jgi:hypothetical protein
MTVGGKVAGLVGSAFVVIALVLLFLPFSNGTSGCGSVVFKERRDYPGAPPGTTCQPGNILCVAGLHADHSPICTGGAYSSRLTPAVIFGAVGVVCLGAMFAFRRQSDTATHRAPGPVRGDHS